MFRPAIQSVRQCYLKLPTPLQPHLAPAVALTSMTQSALLAASLKGNRKVFGGYSGVFGWFSGYSAHLDRLMMWQLIGSGYVRVRPSTILYNIKRVYQRTSGRAGAHEGPRHSASFRILPRALLFVFGLTPLSPPTASHGRKGAHGQIKTSSLEIRRRGSDFSQNVICAKQGCPQ